MNPDKNGDEKLPDGWMLCQSKSNPGRKYYFNKKTGKSSWTQPQDDDKTEENNAKCKKEKDNQNQETSKKEEPRKNLKRKSDGKEDSFSKKKQKPEIQTPEKRKPELSKKESPVKCPDSSKKDSPKKPTPAKNLANTRLSQLRAELSSDISHKPDEEKSPVKNKRYSPKSSHSSSYSSSHSDAKIPKLDLKSPSHTESKSSTTQSPSSDSLQSVPSPSQFFAANKIISSMKAQLPDEYKHTVKPKDTFADIEEGICNQTAEYPFMKHPATPPQFSEASKLMSAIKSKLSYKVATKDTNVKQFSSAKDRMESLRKSLGNEGDVKDIPNHTTCMQNHSLSRQEFPKYIEAMEVDCKEVAQNMPTFPGRNGNTVSKENVVLVVDTNVFIHELDVIKNVLNSHIKGYSEQPTLLVPWRVINELDRLKDNNNGNGAICKRARAAMDYLYKSLPENNRIKGQSLRDSNSHIYPCELPDDEILNCCLQQGERGKSVILLSNDKNLCNKAVVNGVRCIGLLELKPLLESQPQPAADPRLYPGVKHYETNMHRLLANILENEMRAKYHNLWQHVLFKAPPWSLADVLQCLLKHWIAVFSEVFPRIEHLITDLRNALVAIESKDPKSLSQSEVSNFKELCLELARKCQIIPEYMELAKTTVERLLRKCGDDRREMAVIDAFEGLWTVLSSYCAKLSSALGISHSLEDKVAGAEPLHALTGKWPVFSRQIHALTGAMKGALDTDSADPALSEHVTRLETVFKDSLALVCSETSAVNRDNMRLFCTSCRNMLQEAHGKFSELTTLLGVCENHLANK